MKMLKFKKRLRNYRIGGDLLLNAKGVHNLHALRTTGKPCSCYVCQPLDGGRSRRTIKQAVSRGVVEEVGYMDESLDEELMWDGGFE